jgi:hypothetical protein
MRSATVNSANHIQAGDDNFVASSIMAARIGNYDRLPGI